MARPSLAGPGGTEEPGARVPTVQTWTAGTMLGLDLTDEQVDLSRDQLGERLMDAALTGVRECLARQSGPDGEGWPPLEPATIRAKGHSQIGVRTGRMVDSLNSAGGVTRVDRDRATWEPRRSLRGQIEGFNNLRPLIGWTASARAEARRILAEAEGRG